MGRRKDGGRAGWGRGGRGQEAPPLHSPPLQSEIKGTDLHAVGGWGSARGLDNSC